MVMGIDLIPLFFLQFNTIQFILDLYIHMLAVLLVLRF